MQNREFYLEIIKNVSSVVIYGAGLMGKSLYKVLTDKPFEKYVEAFIVNSLENNPNQINETEVIQLSDADSYKHSYILVALHEKYLKDAMKELTDNGFNNLIPVSFDSDLWSDIRGKWMIENGMLNYKKMDKLYSKELHIYVVHSEFDRTLNEDVVDSNYEISIQVGAALSNKIMYEVTDDKGDNISQKNKQYCELTALYWAWKNDLADYIGISHYRRKFLLSNLDIERINNNDIDFIVTTPVLNINTVKGQYCIDHSINDWNVMVEAINNLFPDYLDAVLKTEKGKIYYAYNMFIARRDAFHNYCCWLFPILAYCESKIGQKDDAYQNRYIGFLAERLLTIYLVKHTELKIFIADKHFIEAKVD